MRRMLNFMVVATAGLLVSSVALAAGGEQSTGFGYAVIGAALAMGLGAFGVGLGQGKAASSALEGLTRNPNSSKAVFVPLLLSLVFMELVALLGFVIAFLLLGKI